MEEFIKDEDWVEVEKVPDCIDRVIDNSSCRDENEHHEFAAICDKDKLNNISKSERGSDLSLNEPPTIQSEEEEPLSPVNLSPTSTENSSIDSKNITDSRDITISLLEKRIQALEEGIHFIHTQIHANPGIRQTLKSNQLGGNESKEDNLSTSLPSYIEDLPEDVGFELSDVIESTRKLGNILSKQNQSFPKLSFLNFEAGDIALFMPAFVENRRIWMAFNSGSPHYYLSQESLQAFLSKNKQREQRTSIIGKLVFIEKKIAVPNNDFLLPEGSEFHLCYAEPLYRHDLPPRQIDKHTKCLKTSAK